MNDTVRLHDGIAALGLALPEGAEEKLLDYLGLLAKWNRTYNLTAVRRQEEMVTHHLLDSLAVLPAMQKLCGAVSRGTVPAGRRQSLVDVGSGAGLPGLVLAIADPALTVASIEASQKKAAFQQQAKIDLGLSNVSIHCARAEAVTECFDMAISRAFASLADFVRYAGHLARRLLAMKGVYPAAEIAALPPGWRLVDSYELAVPGLEAHRHLLVLEKS